MANNHLLIEDWLFNQSSLTPEAADALRTHLETCDACRRVSVAWQEVETQLRLSPMLSPEPGFAQRWEARLIADRVMRQRKQTTAALFVSAALILALLAGFAWLSLPVLQNPLPYLLILAYRLTSACYDIAELSGMLGTMVRAVVNLVPATLWVALAVTAGSLIVLWAATYRKLSSMWRVI